MKKYALSFFIAAFLSLVTTAAFPQSIGSSPAFGADMWTSFQAQQNLYSPHTSATCGTGESFVPIGNYNGSLVGFCIEVDARESGEHVSWITAKTTCTSLNKRLPEPMEWQVACLSSAIDYKKGSYEWASNFEFPILGIDNGLIAATAGPDCSDGNASYTNNLKSDWAGYRCVH